MTSSSDSGSGSASEPEPVSSGAEPTSFEPEPAGAALQSIFELYGALDRVVISALASDQPEVATTIDQYMPGASANAGWSLEIKNFFRLPDHPGTTPDTDVAQSVTNALTALTTHTEGVDALSIPEQSNLVYVIGALAHVEAAKSQQNLDLFQEALALAAPDELEGTTKSANAAELLKLLEKNFNGMGSWDDVIKYAATLGLVKSDIAKVPLCRTGVVTVNGYECVVIDADIESDVVKYANLINVIDPRNWPKSYPGFFCTMSDATGRTDKWWNIIERVGFCKVPYPYDYRLITKLKFIKTDQTKNLDARLDFDLAETQDKPPCDRLVTVDRGFVNVLCTNPDQDPMKGGVLMRTRKVAHVKGLSPYAQAFVLCKLGYGWAAVHTFFDPALQDPKALNHYTPWESDPYKAEDPKVPGPPGPSGSGGSGGTTQSTGTPAPSSKPQVATKTAESLREYAEFLTDKQLELTKKWLAGQLSFADLAAAGKEVGAKLGAEPWKWLHKITTNTSSGTSGGATP